MKKKVLLCVLISLLVSTFTFARNSKSSLVADLGDVRIYSLGDGYFEVESDRVQQCFALTFRETGGLVEVACSSYVREITVWGIEEGVNWVVTSYLGYNKFAGIVAGKVAKWAAGKGIDYLCNK